METPKFEWFREFLAKDTRSPERCVDGERIYTLYMKDFMRMPEVNFDRLSMYDVSLKTLFN